MHKKKSAHLQKKKFYLISKMLDEVLMTFKILTHKPENLLTKRSREMTKSVLVGVGKEQFF